MELLRSILGVEYLFKVWCKWHRKSHVTINMNTHTSHIFIREQRL